MNGEQPNPSGVWLRLLAAAFALGAGVAALVVAIVLVRGVVG